MVYHGEFSSLPPTEGRRLRDLRHHNVQEWANLLDADPVEAYFRIYAACTQMIDTGHLVRFDSRPEQLARVSELTRAILLN